MCVPVCATVLVYRGGLAYFANAGADAGDATVRKKGVGVAWSRAVSTVMPGSRWACTAVCCVVSHPMWRLRPALSPLAVHTTTTTTTTCVRSLTC